MKYYVELSGVLDVNLNTDLIGEVNDISIDYKDFYNDFSNIRDIEAKRAIYDLILALSK